MSKLLNWDHDVNPTPFGDIQQNLLGELLKLGVHITPNFEFVVYNGTSIGFLTTEGKFVYNRDKDRSTGASEDYMDRREAVINEYNSYVQ